MTEALCTVILYFLVLVGPKWLDFTNRFWHRECVTKYLLNVFIKVLKKATEIYELAQSCLQTLPYNKLTKELVRLAIKQVNELAFTIAVLQKEMNQLASTLPEYHIVLSMGGGGETLGPQLIAEIGDIRRFIKKQSLVAFSGGCATLPIRKF